MSYDYEYHAKIHAKKNSVENCEKVSKHLNHKRFSENFIYVLLDVVF